MPVRPLSPELDAVAKSELNETPKKLEHGVNELKEWISRQPHLNCRTDDQWIVAFLRGCKYDMDKAKKKLEINTSLKKIAPELHSPQHKDAKFWEILKLGVILVLPKTAQPGDPRTIMIRGGQYFPKRYSPAEIVSTMNLILKFMYINDDNFVVSGAVNLMDLEGTTMGHFTSLSPFVLRKMIIAGQDAAPVRLKGVHYVNMPRGFEIIFNLIKSFLNKKNKKRFYAHSKSSSLYECVSKEILPAEYGGNGGTVQEIIDYWVKKIKDNKEWLDEDEKYGVVEPKKEKATISASENETERSFRRLELD